MDKLSLSMSQIKFSVSPQHCNKMLWEGCITKLGKASDGAPGGADGHRIIITMESAQANHKTFEGMPLNCTFAEGFFGGGEDVFTGHGDLIIGYIERAWIEGDSLMASGYIWKNNFPEVAFQTMNAKNSLGFSVEMYVEAHKDEGDDFTYIDSFTGTGCAMLFSECAAFGETYIKQLVAQREKGVMKMNKEELQALLAASIDAAVSKVSDAMELKFSDALAKFSDLSNAVAEVSGKFDAQKEEITNETIDNLKAELEKVKASVETIKSEKEALQTELDAAKTPERKTGLTFGKFGNKDTDKEAKTNSLAGSIKTAIEEATK